MHSPFVFRFIKNVLNKSTLPDADLLEIESFRQSLLKDKSMVVVEDLGAGSRSTASKQRTISSIAASVVKPPKLSAVLFRLAKYYNPQVIVELGTSLGITTACFSRAVPQSDIFTVEGSASIANAAQINFKTLGCNNINSLQGNFDDVLPSLLSTIKIVDLAYIDGNHRYEPTMRYFQWFLEKTNEHSILVFDDIHWSREMETAWEEIKMHPEVKYTIDVFFLGFVFFRKEFKIKQHFTVRL